MVESVEDVVGILQLLCVSLTPLLFALKSDLKEAPDQHFLLMGSLRKYNRKAQCSEIPSLGKGVSRAA